MNTQTASIAFVVIAACVVAGISLVRWFQSRLIVPAPVPTPGAPAPEQLGEVPQPKQLVRDSFDGDDPLEALLHTCNQFARSGRGDLAQRALQLRLEAARPTLTTSLKPSAFPAAPSEAPEIP